MIELQNLIIFFRSSQSQEGLGVDEESGRKRVGGIRPPHGGEGQAREETQNRGRRK